MLTGATGSIFTVPTAALLLGKTVVLKKAVIEGKELDSFQYSMSLISALSIKQALESLEEKR